jgi:hypothetical protein
MLVSVAKRAMGYRSERTFNQKAIFCTGRNRGALPERNWVIINPGSKTRQCITIQERRGSELHKTPLLGVGAIKLLDA